MSKTATAGKWTFTETDGKVAIAFEGNVVDTVDAVGALAIAEAGLNSVLPASLLPLAKVFEGIAGQALAALE